MKMVVITLILALSELIAAPTPKPSATPKITPTITPVAVTPSVTPKRLQIDPQSEASLIAAQIANQVNAVIAAADLMNNGIPTQGDRPAITPQQIQSALGAENVAKIQAAANALK